MIFSVTADGEVIPEYIRRSKDIYDMGTDHPLRNLVISCLDNTPENRPSAGGIVEFLCSHMPAKVDEPSLASSSESLGKTPLSTTPISVTRMPTRGYDYNFKVVLLGIPGVGKTSIIKRFLHPELEMGAFKTTIDPGDYFERLQIRGKTVHLHIVDTPGEMNSLHHIQSAISSAMPLLYRGVSGVALVYDVGCRISFKQLAEWLKIVRVSSVSSITVVCVVKPCPDTSTALCGYSYRNLTVRCSSNEQALKERFRQKRWNGTSVVTVCARP